MRLLVIEDADILRQSLVTGLTDCGYVVDATADGKEGLWLAEGSPDNQPYDLIILDIMLPGLNGFELLQRLRASGNDTLVLMLSARDETSDRIQGLRNGADDYLPKPFDFDELLARIEALIRRRGGTASNLLQLGELSIDLHRKQVYLGERAINLPPREYALLECLALNRHRIVSRQEIEQKIYDERIEPMSNVVDSAISNLRKLIDHDEGPSLITTRRGRGYQIRQS
ncbi:response regulator transcription factor [Marinobacter nanhaiticus D15-8W]|uniref:DNA-binding response regulator n=1 Tax=Marinobacter nanhaiticus D15-8W TaxID=626887 RepID=N6W6C2_9GAMM|nr:response regulator transcription factor [Marinobacter nanhaiticus]ENO15769.1 DNA-binding response regulator [Marinobacter nanhaiticus D15-8W]BES73373.1 response regulator transcription factor [Marinobacter nanhaiticus D15-8W]